MIGFGFCCCTGTPPEFPPCVNFDGDPPSEIVVKFTGVVTYGIGTSWQCRPGTCESWFDGVEFTLSRVSECAYRYDLPEELYCPEMTSGHLIAIGATLAETNELVVYIQTTVGRPGEWTFVDVSTDPVDWPAMTPPTGIDHYPIDQCHYQDATCEIIDVVL